MRRTITAANFDDDDDSSSQPRIAFMAITECVAEADNTGF